MPLLGSISKRKVFGTLRPPKCSPGNGIPPVHCETSTRAERGDFAMAFAPLLLFSRAQQLPYEEVCFSGIGTAGPGELLEQTGECMQSALLVHTWNTRLAEGTRERYPAGVTRPAREVHRLGRQMLRFREEREDLPPQELAALLHLRARAATRCKQVRGRSRRGQNAGDMWKTCLLSPCAARTYLRQYRMGYAECFRIPKMLGAVLLGCDQCSSCSRGGLATSGPEGSPAP